MQLVTLTLSYLTRRVGEARISMRLQKKHPTLPAADSMHRPLTLQLTLRRRTLPRPSTRAYDHATGHQAVSRLG